MEKLKIKFILIHTLVFISTGFGALNLWKHFFTDHHFEGFALIPTFFLVMGLVFIHILMSSLNMKPRKLVNLYMLLKLVKVFMAIIFSTLFVLISECNTRDFIVVLTLFYVLYMGLETYYFYQAEKYLKKNNTNE